MMIVDNKDIDYIFYVFFFFVDEIGEMLEIVFKFVFDIFNWIFCLFEM